MVFAEAISCWGIQVLEFDHEPAVVLRPDCANQIRGEGGRCVELDFNLGHALEDLDGLATDLAADDGQKKTADVRPDV